MMNLMNANNDTQTIYGAIGGSNRYAAFSSTTIDKQHTEAVQATMSSDSRDGCLTAAAEMISLAAISWILTTLIQTAKALAKYL